MSFFAILFYALAAATLVCTVMAVTRRILMHAVVWMVAALIGTALIFLLLGAPLLAGFEVIVYAGAIMVLFLFVVMLMRQDPNEPERVEAMLQWRLARRLFWPSVLGIVALIGCVSLLSFDPANRTPLPLAHASPHDLGAWVFTNAWPAVEAVSLLLFAALAGARFLGMPLVRGDRGPGAPKDAPNIGPEVKRG